jgi:hypothetical protein
MNRPSEDYAALTGGGDWVSSIVEADMEGISRHCFGTLSLVGGSDWVASLVKFDVEGVGWHSISTFGFVRTNDWVSSIIEAEIIGWLSISTFGFVCTNDWVSGIIEAEIVGGLSVSTLSDGNDVSLCIGGNGISGFVETDVESVGWLGTRTLVYSMGNRIQSI